MGNLIEGALQLWHRAIDYVEYCKRDAAAKRELSALSAGECSVVLHDLGVTRQELEEAIRLPYASQDLYGEALKAIGIDQRALEARYGAWSRDMQRTCMSCRCRRRCRREIAAARFAADYRTFCPNADDFAELAGDPKVRASMMPTAALVA